MTVPRATLGARASRMNINSLLRELSGPRPSRRVVDRANLGCWHPSTTDIHIPSLRDSHPLSNLKVFACLRDLRRQCSQPLLPVSFKDIAIPPLLWCNVDYELGIARYTSRSDEPRRLLEFEEAELGPYRADTVEDREGRAF